MASGHRFDVAIAALGALLASAPDARAAAPALRTNVPVSFEANAGQSDPAVRFLARSAGADLFLTAGEAVLAVRDRDGRRDAVHLRPIGARRDVEPVAERPLAARSHYLVGSDPSQWRRDVPHFERVRYRDLWPGIDLVFRGDPQRLEYDLEVAAGADPAAIRLAWIGAQAPRLDAASGELRIETGAGPIVQHAPRIQQERDGATRAVEGRFALDAGGALRVVLGDYDRTRPLVIDPVIQYGTYLGAGLAEAAYDVAVDAAGNAYLTGVTVSPAFPTQGAFQGMLAGNADAFVTKIAPDGATLVYSTFFGGLFKDTALGISVDPLGRATIAGSTASLDLPMVNALQPLPPAVPNAFVAMLAPNGASLVFSTYLGGAGSDSAWGVGADEAGRVTVTGETSSADFPLLAPAQPTKSGAFDAFVSSFEPDGTLVYSTFWGGGAAEIARSVAMSRDGDALVAGQTQSCNFPVVAAWQPGCGGGADGWAVRFDPDGAVLFATYLGGSVDDYAFGAAIDAHGSGYVTGRTGSTNFPTFVPLQPFSAGLADAFVVKLDRNGSPLYSTYLGGSGPENRTPIEDLFRNGGIEADANGSAFVAGLTSSDDFPVESAFQPARAGNDDAWVARLTPDGQALVWSSYLGGSGRDTGRGVGLDSAGNAYVAGDTESANFPATLGSFRPGPAGATDAFAVRVGGPPACSNGIDDDGDGAIDQPADLGCFAPSSLREDPPCANGVDDDGDLAVDLADAGCRAKSDESEGVDCGDGLDNDGDGRTDGADPGCQDANGIRENPGCDDDADNDGDGRIDWDGGLAGTLPDPNCSAGWKREKPPSSCGLGVELLGALGVLAGRARSRRSPCQGPSSA